MRIVGMTIEQCVGQGCKESEETYGYEYFSPNLLGLKTFLSHPSICFLISVTWVLNSFSNCFTFLTILLFFFSIH